MLFDKIIMANMFKSNILRDKILKGNSSTVYASFESDIFSWKIWFQGYGLVIQFVVLSLRWPHMFLLSALMIGELMLQSMTNPQTVLLISQLGYSTPHLLNFQDCRSPKWMTFLKLNGHFQEDQLNLCD